MAQTVEERKAVRAAASRRWNANNPGRSRTWRMDNPAGFLLKEVRNRTRKRGYLPVCSPLSG